MRSGLRARGTGGAAAATAAVAAEAAGDSQYSTPIPHAINLNQRAGQGQPTLPLPLPPPPHLALLHALTAYDPGTPDVPPFPCPVSDTPYLLDLEPQKLELGTASSSTGDATGAHVGGGGAGGMGGGRSQLCAGDHVEVVAECVLVEEEGAEGTR